MFGYFKNQEEVQFTKTLPLQPRKRNVVKWIGVAASFVILFGTAFFYMNSNASNEDLGTFDDPEVAFIETQNLSKATLFTLDVISKPFSMFLTPF